MVSLKKLLLFITILAILAIPKQVYAKSYSYDYINMKIDLFQNGSIIVSQERAYNFVGSFSYAYLDLLKKGAQDIDFIEIRDLKTNQPLQFSIEEDSSHIKATWYYSASYEVRKFLIVYKIEGAIKRYEDVAEFYWKVIEDYHERIDKLNAEINLPSPSPNLFKVFVHSSTNPGKLNFSEDFKKAYVSLENIPKDTFVEFRVLTQPEIFSIAEIPEKKYEAILNEEKNIFFQSSIYSFFSSIQFYILLSFMPILALGILYLKYGREPKVEYDLEYEQEPPRKIPPMALANLIEGEEMKGDIKIEAMGLIATIFDLARRGYVEVREEKKKKFFGLMEKTEQVFLLTEKGRKEWRSETRELIDFERDVLSFIFSCGSERDKVSSSEITSYCRKNRIEVKEKIERIDEKARDWFEENIFPITDKKSSKVMNTFSGVVIVCVLVTFFLLYFSRNILLLLLFSSFFISAVASRAISKRTPESALEIKRWLAFRNFIRDFSEMKEAPIILLQIWDEYLVYAIVFGIAKKFLENLKDLSLKVKQPIAPIVWYHGITPTPTGRISPEAMTGFINNLSNTINALSSSSSVGGGFSGGGGGGGGGGGSGAG
jgi:uncharacterized membrane protein